MKEQLCDMLENNVEAFWRPLSQHIALFPILCNFSLTDFIADWTPGAHEEEVSKDDEAWTVFCDGSWGTFGAGAAAVLVAPSKVKTCYAAKLDFSCTNNIAEYEALLLGFGN